MVVGGRNDDRGPQGFDVVGIEESASGVAQAQQAYPNCQFRQGSIYDLDLADLEQAFDLVISTEVIEHLFYPRELVRVARQCLRPGGTLILTTPYHGYFKNLALALSGKLDSHFTTLWDYIASATSSPNTATSNSTAS